jgi:hypothetical protein
VLEVRKGNPLSLTRHKRRGYRYYLTRYEANGDIYKLRWSALKSVADTAFLITPDGEEWAYVLTERGLNMLAYHLGNSPQKVVFELLEGIMDDAIERVKLYQENCSNEKAQSNRGRKRLK